MLLNIYFSYDATRRYIFERCIWLDPNRSELSSDQATRFDESASELFQKYMHVCRPIESPGRANRPLVSCTDRSGAASR